MALAKAGIGLPIRGFTEIAAGLPGLRIPVRVVYGEQDRILPDVSETMERLARDVPHAQVTALSGCGHFLQEEAPGDVAELLVRSSPPSHSRSHRTPVKRRRAPMHPSDGGRTGHRSRASG